MASMFPLGTVCFRFPSHDFMKAISSVCATVIRPASTRTSELGPLLSANDDIVTACAW